MGKTCGSKDFLNFWHLEHPSILNSTHTEWKYKIFLSAMTKQIPYLHCFRRPTDISVKIFRPPVCSRDSRFSRLGTETPRLSVQVSSRNRTRYRNSGLRSLRIGLGTETQTFQVSDSNRNRMSDIASLRIGAGIEM